MSKFPTGALAELLTGDGLREEVGGRAFGAAFDGVLDAEGVGLAAGAAAG